MSDLNYAIKNNNILKYFRSLESQEQAFKDLNTLDQDYYNGKPLISDTTYDAVRDYLNIRFPELAKKVGKNEKENSVWPKANLKINMGSLLKINEEEELTKWYPKYTTGTVVTSFKADGLSLELTYVDGEFQQAITRGDGFVGDDITPNARKFKFPKKIKELGEVQVRAEAILYKSDWEKYFKVKGDKSPRNSAAGTIRRLDGTGCEHIRILAFDIISSNNYDTKIGKYSVLSELGFDIPSPRVMDNIDSVIKIYEHTDENRDSIPYEIDGLVIEENDIEKAIALGSADNRPRAARAYKFENESAECTLLDIVWQVGKTGSLTPVGIISPTTIQGITISRVMLNNPSHMSNLGIKIGSKAKLVRANDVIPKIVKVLDNKGGRDISIPSSCPSCGSKIDASNLKNVICPNHEECPAQTSYRIVHFLSTMKVKGIGDSIVDKLLDAGIIKDIPDLYTINMDKVKEVEGVASANVLKAYKELVKKSKSITLPQFIKSISIKNIGTSATEAVMPLYPTIDDLFKMKVEDIVKIEKIGESKASDFVFGINAKKELIEKLLPFVTITKKATGGPLSEMVFCFTGFRDSELSETIERLGGTMAASVTKATTHLVCKNTNSLSSKAKKAKDEGKAILSIDDLKELLEDKGE